MRLTPLHRLIRPHIRRSAGGACLILAFGVACSDYGLDGKEDPVTGHDSADTGGGVDTEGSQGEELCNGLDDDGDGLVDEDFSDDDGDGIADCREAACPSLEVGVAGARTVEESCLATPSVVADPWGFVVEWGYVAANTDETSVSPPRRREPHRRRRRRRHR